MTPQLSTDIRMQQMQVLAPQLQQSLRMLQLPSMDLQALLAQQLATNPVLEQYDPIRDDASEEGSLASFDPDCQDKAGAEEKWNQTVSSERAELALDTDSETRAEHLLENGSGVTIDDEGESNYISRDSTFESHGYEYESVSYRENRPYEDEEYRFRMQSIPAGETLADELRAQYRSMVENEENVEIFEYILGSLDASGFLTETAETIAAELNEPVEHVREVIETFRTFDPPGIGAPDLRACLLIQLTRQGRSETYPYQIISDYFDELVAHKLNVIARGLGITHEALQEAISEIGALDPRPGRELYSGISQAISPDILVTRTPEGTYHVETNDTLLPYVRVSPHIRKMLKEKQIKKQEKQYMREQIQAGDFLIHNLEFRKRTILAVAEAIVETQQEFLDDGPTHIKPLGMKEIAERVGVHEATVSRTVNGKYMDTPQGIYEMRYFFSANVGEEEGLEVSTNAAKATLKNIIAEEDKKKPYSDEKLAERMQAAGYPVARRTVVKYRKAMGIANMRHRKEYV